MFSIVSAQTLSVTPDSNGLNPQGGAATFIVDIGFSGRAIVSFETTLPNRWSYVSGSAEPDAKPAVSAGGTLNWANSAAVSGPVTFSFTVSYPAGAVRTTVPCSAFLEQPAGGTRITVNPVAFGPPGMPIILQQPQNFTTVLTAGWYSSVVAGGSPPLTYQWRKDSLPIAGATNASYGAVSSMSTRDSGRYDVIVSNALGSIASDAAVLTVLNINPNPGQAPPVIDTQPLDTSSPAGGAASFTALVFSNYAPSYQWSKNGAPILEATGAALVLPNVQPDDAGSYSVTVRNPYGSVTSRGALLTVDAPPSRGDPPIVVTSPISHVVPAGEVVRLHVNATGSAPLSYQWLHGGTPIIGSTSSTLEISTARASAGGNYSVVVTNAIGAVTSESAVVSPISSGIAPIKLDSMDVVKTVAGGSVVFTPRSTGSPPVRYQWFKDNVALAGATAASLLLSNVTPADAGLYRVNFSNSFGSGVAGGTLMVLSESVAPSFVLQPTTPGGEGIGSPVRIFANVDGTAPFTFQWLKNGRELPGATSVPLEIPAFKTTDAGSYSLRVSNAAATATSSAFTLAARSPGYATIGVGPLQLPAITAQPRRTTAREGASASFYVSAVADALPLSYQWRRDGIAISGGTGASYTVPSVTASDSGEYSVVVWNPRGMVVSEAARLAIEGRSYAGSYIGSMIGSNTEWGPNPFCIYVRDDNTAVVFGPFGDGRAFTVGDAGHFSFGQGATSGSIAGANAAFSFSGDIAPNGGLTGTYHHPLLGLTIALAATRATVADSLMSPGGLYRINAANSSAAGSVVVDSSGRVFATVSAPGRSDFGVGTIDSGGRISIAGASGAQSSGTANPDGTLAANVTFGGSNKALSFAGGRETRPDPERLINISTRANAADGDPLIAGFVVAGTEPRPVLIRAIGPTLANFDVTTSLSAVRLELFRGSVPIASNLGWDAGDTATNAAIVSTSRLVGAFALPSGSKDAVLLMTLEPGAYTAHASGAAGTTGIALVEVYDAAGASTTADRRLINISTRGRVAAGDNALVAGFVISGTVPKRVLVRGIGPALAPLGVASALADPQVQLFHSTGIVLATNDDWGSGEVGAAAQAQLGAFPLPIGSKDAVLIIALEPGSYTAQVSGVGTATGTALVEVYELP